MYVDLDGAYDSLSLPDLERMRKDEESILD